MSLHLAVAVVAGGGALRTIAGSIGARSAAARCAAGSLSLELARTALVRHVAHQRTDLGCALYAHRAVRDDRTLGFHLDQVEVGRHGTREVVDHDLGGRAAHHATRRTR